MDKERAGYVSVERMLDCFSCGNNNDFKEGRVTKEELFEAAGFGEIVKDGNVSKEDFLELYTDVSMGIEDTRFFVEMVQHTWDFYLQGTCSQTRDSAVRLTALIRQRLLSLSNKQSDEYMLRNIFNEFDVNKSGTLTADELQAMLIQLQISCDSSHLKEILSRFYHNGSGSIEFEEFLHFIIHDPYK